MTASETDRTEHADDASVAWRVFAVLWAISLLYDGAVRTMTHDPHQLLVTIAAVAALLKPGAPWRLALAAAAQLLLVADTPPKRMMIHWYFNGAVNVAILLGWLSCALRARSPRVDPAAALRAVRPAAMLVGLSALTFAGFSKINRSFLDPELSCGAVLYLIQAESWSFLPDTEWAKRSAIWGTLLAEIGGPLLLCFRRTRPLALILLGGFFFTIGANPVNHLYEFAGPVLTACLLALGARPTAAAWRAVASSPLRWIPELLRPLRVPLLLAALAGFAWLSIEGDSKGTRPLRQDLARWTWLLGEPALIASLLWATLRTPGASLRTLAASGPRWLLLLPLIFVLHEATPYAGMRHRISFTMAGNLRTLDGYGNHLLIRQVPDLYWNRRVEIVGSDNDDWLKKHARRRSIMTFFSFADHMARHPDSEARILIRGEPESIPRAGDDPRFARRPPLAEWFRFRPDGRGSRLDCSHRRKLDTLRKAKR